MLDIFRKIEQGAQRTKETWFRQVAQLFDRATIDEGLWDELEELLILADVGVNTTTKLLHRVKERVKRGEIKEASEVKNALQEEMLALLAVDEKTLATGERPGVILVVGVNGTGKTTSIAKLARYYLQDGKTVLLAAADTFRAAAIDQLKVWAQRVGVEVVAHQPGADPGAVVFDALQAARSRGMDLVIVDTAGRLHTKYNLMEELKKLKRVLAKLAPSEPREVLLVLDATTGQNGLSQARYFDESVGVTGIFLAKLDGTAKGGIVLAICDELGLPIRFIGTGEQLDDLAPFDAQEFVHALFT